MQYAYLKKSAKTVFFIIFLMLSIASGQVQALGECGLACCLAGATSSGMTTAKNFGLAVQYEYSDMETIRHGTDSISPDAVLNKFWMPGGTYMVPTRMKMEKLSIIGALPINERWQVIGIVPIQRNRMDMRMRNAMGMSMDTKMDTISGLGDVSVLGQYVVYTDAPIRPKKRLILGFGIKMPTGNNNARTANGNMVHAMMQLGSGSWDGLFTVNYLKANYPLVMQVNAFYHLTTKGDEGYKFGDQIGLDLILRYQVSSYVNLGLDFNVIHATRDKDYDGQYSRPMMSMADNVNNTGLTSMFISPAIQYKIPDSGGSIELKYQHPVHQNVRGYQQVLDGRWLATLAWGW